jgi:hypothetical protein
VRTAARTPSARVSGDASGIAAAHAGHGPGTVTRSAPLASGSTRSSSSMPNPIPNCPWKGRLVV